MPKKPRSGCDEGWKMILERYFPQFLEFFFPAIYREIVLDRIEFTRGDFQKITRESEVGARYADIIAGVTLKEGGDRLILVHVEVQGEADGDFGKRLFVYNYRIFDRFERDVVTLAVLTGDAPAVPSFRYGFNLWGFRHWFEFPVVSVMAYRNRVAELERSANPFAVVALTHIRYREAFGDYDQRLFWKTTLVKSLYHKGYCKEDVLNLYYFIDWVIALPEELAERFTETIRAYEEELKVAYISSAERYGMKRGLQEGMEKGIEKGEVKKQRDIGRKMKENGEPAAKIMLYTGLSVEEIEAL